MQTQTVSIEIEKYRSDPSARAWELPAWGHPISHGVLPLFIAYEGHLFPIGTAFTIGRGVSFVISAAHNVRESWKYERRLTHLLTAQELPKSVSLKHAGISVLHQSKKTDGVAALMFLPLETVNGAPPTDIVFGFPKFVEGLMTLTNRLSFDLPRIGEKIWSIGYSDFKFPEAGISMSDVQSGTFDWENDYGHRLMVVEGNVERVFVQKFASGYVEGPCFTFDAEISHAQSGGPVMSTDGVVRGINSAGASAFFDKPTSIASLLYPLLFSNLQFGVTMGPMRFDSTNPLIDLIGRGVIDTDGSEERVGITRDDVTGSYCVHARAGSDMNGFIFDDFSGYQSQRGATRGQHATLRLRKSE